MQVTRIDQVAVVVHDLDAAVAHYARLLGRAPTYRIRLDDAGIEEAMYDIDGVWLQVIAPISEASVVSEFLAEHGPGLHHLGFGVPAIETAIAEARSVGAVIREPAPRTGGGGHPIAFVEPVPIDGVLIELVEDAPAAPTGGPGAVDS